jgi:hypothetical protein
VARQGGKGTVTDFESRLSESCWGKIESCWGKIESCWGKIESCWGKIESCWGKIESCWGKIESHWGDSPGGGVNPPRPPALIRTKTSRT